MDGKAKTQLNLQKRCLVVKPNTGVAALVKQTDESSQRASKTPQAKVTFSQDTKGLDLLKVSKALVAPRQFEKLQPVLEVSSVQEMSVASPSIEASG